ncbi:MAG: hypothetical protein K2O14_02850 [Oscillospiraceae bacterium]|nr:hypothetical protein [Oscillospiraceae bacterium]
MKKLTLICILALAALFGITGCAASNSESSGAAKNTPPPEEPILTEITITAGETVLDGVLFDNYTARCFADMLPLTSALWNPADGYAKAFDLPSEISDSDERTRNYELGSLAYWFEGPSIAIIHNDNREQTVVPVVPIGKITSDVGMFFSYGNNNETVTIEKKESETS